MLFFKLFFPVPVHAHVKWFVEENITSEPLWATLPTATIVWSAILLVLIGIAWVLERTIQNPRSLEHLGQNWEHLIVRLFHTLVGAWLLATAYNDALIAVNIPVESTIDQALLVIQVLVGFFLLFGILVPWASLLLLALYAGVAASGHLMPLTEHIEVVGIALYLFLVKPPKHLGVAYYKKWAIPLLRVTTGISLIVLAFTEKIQNPQLALQFLETHPWNFMQWLGLSQFSNELFVLSAGMTEMLFGVLLLLGLMTRLNTLVLSLFFITTTILMGPIELVGHLPFFGMVVIFILFGSGDKFKITNILGR